MIEKKKEKEKAIKLRHKGFSYSEILKTVPIAKSTLSVWLREIGVAKRYKQRLTEKRRQAQFKAQQACREKRIKITEEIKFLARNEIGKISKRELWLIGTALYWGEGTKQGIRNVSARVTFSNSDPKMIRIFLRWLMVCCNIQKKDISFSVYLHETAKSREAEIRSFWAKTTLFSLSQFSNTIWKRNKIKKKKREASEGYYGLLRITVYRSANFNRKISGWIEGIYQNCGVG